MSALTTPMAYWMFALWGPLIPALLSYRLLPSSTRVEGPFAGLRIKLGGAFGGYFLLVLAGIIVLRPYMNTSEEVWQVRGTVVAPHGAAGPVDLEIIARPEPLELDTRSGEFKLQVSRVRGHAGQWEFPVLMVSSPGYQPWTVDLNDVEVREAQGIRLKDGVKTIELNTPVRLTRDTLEAYDSTGGSVAETPRGEA